MSHLSVDTRKAERFSGGGLMLSPHFIFRQLLFSQPVNLIPLNCCFYFSQ